MEKVLLPVWAHTLDIGSKESKDLKDLVGLSRASCGGGREETHWILTFSGAEVSWLMTCSSQRRRGDCSAKIVTPKSVYSFRKHEISVTFACFLWSGAFQHPGKCPRLVPGWGNRKADGQAGRQADTRSLSWWSWAIVQRKIQDSLDQRD